MALPSIIRTAWIVRVGLIVGLGAFGAGCTDYADPMSAESTGNERKKLIDWGEIGVATGNQCQEFTAPAPAGFRQPDQQSLKQLNESCEDTPPETWPCPPTAIVQWVWQPNQIMFIGSVARLGFFGNKYRGWIPDASGFGLLAHVEATLSYAQCLFGPGVQVTGGYVYVVINSTTNQVVGP